MKFTSPITLLYCFCLILFSSVYAKAQCLQIPAPLDMRIDQAHRIALVHVEDQIPYILEDGNIYTLNIARVESWLKNAGGDTKVGIISYGGVVGDKAQVTYPSLQLDTWHDYLLFLEEDNTRIDNKEMRLAYPGIQQCEPFCLNQGSLTFEFGKYHDLMVEAPTTEKALFSYIQSRTGQPALTPEGIAYKSREFSPEMLGNRSQPITGISPNPTRAGTIVTGDFITITGSGFGAAAGTVFYTNADDGGATFTASGVATDNVSWSATSIQNKPAQNAGTGPINVNGSFTSPTNLTINYAHTAINSTFSGFGASTRQRYYFRNLNSNGGYNFTYNSNFAANAAAKAAFERSLSTWRCASGMNWVPLPGTSSSTSITADGISLVVFTNALPGNVVGLATSRFNGSATGACNLANTVWWLSEIDVEFRDPSLANWNFGPDEPTFTETDFESVATHELGHGHGLNHRIAPGETMNYLIVAGENLRTPATQEVLGAQARIAYSTTPTCFNPANSGTQHVAVPPATCNLALPLRWLAFYGSALPGGNQLNWKVSAEKNLKDYEVERSADGRQFSSLGHLPYQEAGSAENAYAFLDSKPLKGINYYRIRQNDLDGAYTYSEVISLHKDGEQAILYPSPTKDKINLRNLNTRNLSLFNPQGQVVREWVISEGESELSLEGLPSGIYWLQSRDDGQVWKVLYQP